ncbi:PIR protein CIR protein [Plasmodium vinckei brucechwatti]|uniref:PIR protein CIR protein n=1 Tax=Plasmodium vinckei brucechwatti TaxID=119398 RepID=A0A6V7S0G9_PLAVN|nr:PIR protein CIR protein [Plasmodium vinckei brucechwatti]
MNDKTCDFLYEVDEIFTRGTVDEKKFNKFAKCHSYCPYENNSKKNKCTNDYERINALGSYLFNEIREINKDFKGATSDKRYIEVFMMWLGDKLFKIEYDYKTTLEEYYKNNLEKYMGNFNYWKAIDSKKLYKKATIKKMNELYNLLSHICKLIIGYNTYIQTPNKNNRNRLGNYSAQCISHYRAIINSANGCKPYLQLLDSLKMIYENFRMYQIDYNNDIKETDKKLLLNRIQHLTRFKGVNQYLLGVTAKPSFDDTECVEVKSKDEQIGKSIASQKPKNFARGTQTRVSGNAQRRNPGSPQPKQPPPAPAKPPTTPRVQPQPQPQAVQSTDTQQTDPPVSPPQDGSSLKTPKTAEIHQNGQGGTSGEKGGKSSGSVVAQGDQGGSSGGSVDGQGSGAHGSGGASGGPGASKSGQGSGVHGSGGTGIRSGDQAVKGSQEGIGGGTSGGQGRPSSGASGGQGSQGITSGGAGGGKGDAGSGGNVGGSAQGDQGKSHGGTGSVQGGQAKGTGDPSRGNSVPASYGTGTTQSPGTSQPNPPQPVLPLSQNDSSLQRLQTGGSSNGSGNPGDGSSDPVSSTSGGSFGFGSSFLEFLFNGTDKFNKASEFIKDNQQKFKDATEKISGAYNNTVKNLKSAYNASSDYLNNFISNMTSQLNQFDPIPKSGGNQTGSGSSTDGGNPSNPSTKDPPSTPPSSIPNPIQDPPKGSLQQSQSPPQSKPIIQKPAQVNQTNHQKIGQFVKSLSSDLILKKPWNIFPTTWNGSGDCKPEVNFMNATLVCCTSEQCSLTGISVILVLIPIILLIAYKYLSFGSSKKSEKKNMKRVINFHDGKSKTKIIISSNDNKKKLKPVINSVGGKKGPLLNIYKLIRADPMPFINLFFLLIFFVYKRKRDTIE